MRRYLGIVRVTSCFALACLSSCQATAPAPTRIVQSETFRSTLLERGQIGSESELKLSTVTSAKLDTLLPEGTVVKPGDIVVKLDDAEARETFERVSLKGRQNALQRPLSREKDRLEVWRLGIERDNAKLDLQIAKLNFEALSTVRDRAAIVEAAQGLGTLKAEHEALGTTLPEAERLHAKGYMSDVELAAMRRKLAENEAQATATRARLTALTAGPRHEELALERLKVEQAASALAGAEKRLRAGQIAAKLDLESVERAVARSTETTGYRRKVLDGARLKATGAGVVTYEEVWTGSTLAKVKVGDTVDEGTAIVTVADPSKQIVRATVDDARAARLAVGQAVHCRFDAFPGLVVEGRVAALAPVAGTRIDNDVAKLQGVEVRVTLAKPDARLAPGMSANVEFVLASEPGRLAVPTEAVGRDAHRSWVSVWPHPTGVRGLWARVRGLKPEQRAVTIGATNDRETCITTGLAAGDEVLLTPGAAL